METAPEMDHGQTGPAEACETAGDVVALILTLLQGSNLPREQQCRRV
jgi:hypothetical protein